MTVLPAFIDIEASGFGRGSYPIEIGFVDAQGRPHCTLVRPAEDWLHWAATAEDIHGIARELLLQHGRPVEEVARWLNEHLVHQRVYCDGWAHDYAWLARLFDEAQLPMRFSLRHVRELLEEADLRRWDDACAQARQALRLDRHRASNDARVLQMALQLLRPQQEAFSG